jgi:uncharacterized membrane protein AbrB (regulator of aidB expression)
MRIPPFMTNAARWCLVALVVFAAIGIYTGNLMDWLNSDSPVMMYSLIGVSLVSLFFPMKQIYICMGCGTEFKTDQCPRCNRNNQERYS